MEQLMQRVFLVHLFAKTIPHCEFFLCIDKNRPPKRSVFMKMITEQLSRVEPFVGYHRDGSSLLLLLSRNELKLGKF